MKASLTSNKASSTNAIAGNIVLNGGSLAWLSTSSQIADTASITVNGGGFSLSDRSETVTSFTLNGGAYTGTGSSSGSTFTATISTMLNGGTWTLIGRQAFWTTGTLTISGGTNTIITNSGFNAALTVNTGLVINQPGSGAFTALALTNLVTTNPASLNLNGDLTFNGNVGNTNSTSITASTLFDGLAANNRITISKAVTTFTVGDGGAPVDLIIQPGISESAAGKALTKEGAGTLELQGANTYTGATNVNAGRLIVSGSLSGSSAVTVGPAGTLGGSGTVGAVTVNSGGTIAPGNNSPGTLTTVLGRDVTLAGGARMEMDLRSIPSDGTEGTDWDLLSSGGLLDISSLSSSNRFILKLQSLTANNTPGLLAGFDSTQNYAWTFATAFDGFFVPDPGGFNSNLFTVDTSGFQNSFNGSFSVTADDVDFPTSLRLTYLVPEPQTWAMTVGGFGVLLAFRRPRRSRS